QEPRGFFSREDEQSYGATFRPRGAARLTAALRTCVRDWALVGKGVPVQAANRSGSVIPLSRDHSRLIALCLLRTSPLDQRLLRDCDPTERRPLPANTRPTSPARYLARRCFRLSLSITVWLIASAASANGRFPRAQRLVES